MLEGEFDPPEKDPGVSGLHSEPAPFPQSTNFDNFFPELNEFYLPNCDILMKNGTKHD